MVHVYNLLDYLVCSEQTIRSRNFNIKDFGNIQTIENIQNHLYKVSKYTFKCADFK